MSLKSLIRTIPDYPKPGIQFRDISGLLENPKGLRLAIEGLAEPFRGAHVDKVAGIEARGFLFGVSTAIELEAGFVPVRKAGKLPGPTIGREYDLEYGSDRVEVHANAITPGERVLVVDDLIATGGTVEATIALLSGTGAVIVGCAFVVDLPDLGGSRKVEAAGSQVVSLCSFDGE
jgi:adenine phosphoribosyltransferase